MFNSLLASGLTAQSFLICTAVSLVLGLLTALCFSFRASFSKSFCLTLAILPAIVQVIIMMVSGSIGAGVAVAGTFSLVRFRSEPGTARQIAALFLSVALGIALGMGYAVLAGVFFLIVTLFFLLLTLVGFGGEHGAQRDLRITIPENLDYEGVFDDLFQQYTTSHSLERVRTTNMGTLYEIRYTVVLKDEKQLKAFMDELRARNGNLTIVCGRVSTERALEQHITPSAISADGALFMGEGDILRNFVAIFQNSKYTVGVNLSGGESRRNESGGTKWNR